VAQQLTTIHSWRTCARTNLLFQILVNNLTLYVGNLSVQSGDLCTSVGHFRYSVMQLLLHSFQKTAAETA
jgi:hypothetical protein